MKRTKDQEPVTGSSRPVEDPTQRDLDVWAHIGDDFKGKSSEYRKELGRDLEVFGTFLAGIRSNFSTSDYDNAGVTNEIPQEVLDQAKEVGYLIAKGNYEGLKRKGFTDDDIFALNHGDPGYTHSPKRFSPLPISQSEPNEQIRIGDKLLSSDGTSLTMKNFLERLGFKIVGDGRVKNLKRKR